MATSQILQRPSIPGGALDAVDNTPETDALLRLIHSWERRLRLTYTARWIPRGAGAGLIAALLVAVIARLSPWLLPNQLAVIAGIFAVGGMVIASVGVWIWPRSVTHSARDFDRRFGLRERISTALELGHDAFGTEMLQSLQRRDALDHAQKIRARDWLPLQWQWRELAATGGLIAACALAIGLPNPEIAVVAKNNAIQAAVAQAVQQITQIEQGIQANAALSDAQKAALNKIAEDALKQLSQQNISQQEAGAALSQAAQVFANSGAQPTDAQRQAAQQAGQALTQGAFDATQGGAGGAQAGLQALGGALQHGNLSQAANGAQALAQEIQSGQVTGQQAQNAANALNAAAQALKNSDSALSQDLQNAANALRSGDNNAASQALNQAAAQLQAEQNNLAQSPVSKAVQAAAQQASQDQQNVLQAGNQGQSQNQNGQGNQGQPGQGDANNSANMSQSQANASQSGATGQGGQSSQSNQGNQNGNVQGQAGQSPAGIGSSASDGNPNGVQAVNGADGAPNGSNVGSQGQTGTGGQSPGQGANGGSGTGQGSGSGGSSATNGQGSGTTLNGVMPANGGANSGGSADTNEQVYDPSFIGGSGGPTINLPNNSNNNSGSTQPGAYANPNSGTANVPLQSVAGAAAAQADSAMNADQVPIGLRGVIHDYFSGLQSSPGSQPAAPAPSSP